MMAGTFLQPMLGLKKFILFQLLFLGARAQLLGILRTPGAAGLLKSSLQTKRFLQIGQIFPATTVALTAPPFWRNKAITARGPAEPGWKPPAREDDSTKTRSDISPPPLPTVFSRNPRPRYPSCFATTCFAGL